VPLKNGLQPPVDVEPDLMCIERGWYRTSEGCKASTHPHFK
jgi:hypothetical protein